MNNTEYLICRTNYPSIVRWSKDGVILISKKEELNLDILFKKDATETLFMIDDFIDQCENIKHCIQLKEIKNHYVKIYNRL